MKANQPNTSDVEQEAIRASLLAIAAGHDGLLNAADIVAAASDPASPLHSQFEWDDGEAATAYRLAQAGALVRRIKLTIVRPQAENRSEVAVTTTRAFQSRPSQRTSTGGYESIADIMTDSGKRAELIAQVLRELQSYRRRYSELQELREVWNALDDTVAEFGDEPTMRAHQAQDARQGGAV